LWLITSLAYIPITLTTIHGHSEMAELMGPTLNFWWGCWVNYRYCFNYNRFITFLQSLYGQAK